VLKIKLSHSMDVSDTGCGGGNERNETKPMRWHLGRGPRSSFAGCGCRFQHLDGARRFVRLDVEDCKRWLSLGRGSLFSSDGHGRTERFRWGVA